MGQASPQGKIALGLGEYRNRIASREQNVTYLHQFSTLQPTAIFLTEIPPHFTYFYDKVVCKFSNHNIEVGAISVADETSGKCRRGRYLDPRLPRPPHRPDSNKDRVVQSNQRQQSHSDSPDPTKFILGRAAAYGLSSPSCMCVRMH